MTLDELKNQLRKSIEKEQKSQQPKVGVLDVAKEVPGAFAKVGKGIFNFGKSVIQGTARSGAAAVATVARGEEKLREKVFGPKSVDYRVPTTIEQIGPSKFLFGNKPIQDVPETGGQFLKDVGAEGLSKNKLASSLVGATIVGLDFTTGGGKDDVIKALAKNTDELKIFSLLKKINVADDIATDYAPVIAKTSKTAEVSKLISRIEDLQKSTKVASQPTKLVAQTTEIPEQLTKIVPRQIDSILKEAPKDISSYYNVNRLNITDTARQAVKQEIESAGKILQNTVGKTLSNKEVQKIATVTSKVLDRTVTRQQTAETIAANLKLRQKIASVAQSGKIDKNFVDLWIKDKAAGEDIARQLQARRINADPKEVGIIDIVLDAIYKQSKNADEVIKAADGVDFTDAKQVTELYRKFVKPKMGEWVDLLRYNSMLTSPNTHIINTVSNFQGTGLIAPLEKTLTGLIDATRSVLTGKPRQYAIGEGAAYAKGYYTNLSKAFNNFTDVIKGKALIRHPDVRRIPLVTEGIPKAIEKTLNFPMRLLEGMDIFFTTLTEGGLEKALSYAAKKNIIRSVDIASEAAQRVFREGGKQQGYVLNAIDSLTNLILAARNSENPILSTISKFTLPFVRTPTELFKQGIEYSPLGISTLVGAGNKTEQLSKIIIGTASAAGAATLLGQDRLTWAEPTGAKEKAEFRAAGRQPYSIRIGDKWVSYSKLHPALAFNFALISSIDDAQRKQRLDETEAEALLSAFAKWGNFLADQSYLKNIGDFVSATKGDMGGYTKLVSNYPQQLIPFRALLSWVNRLTDPVQRQADPEGSLLDRQMQQFMSQIPLLSQKVPERLGPLGEPIENQNRVLNAFSPNRITSVEPSYEAIFQIKRQGRDLDRLKKDLRDGIRKEIQKSIQFAR